MPLRDHFRPPLSEISSWEEVHGGWPMVIVQQLHKVLPPPYVAGPRVHFGSEVEIDAATFESETPVGTFRPPAEEPFGVATAWAPAEPTLAVETELSDFDEYEVRVFDTRRGRRLVAAVELVSPANKDRPELPLPCLPLWLTEHLAIPLDLEASYEQTCHDLRIA